MSDASNRILEQVQAQTDLRMEAAQDIAEAVSDRVAAERKLEEDKAFEKQAFSVTLK